MREREQFAGPVFLVGMPRSGTKLLRDLLNNHSQIAIAPNESHFIPHFYSNLERYGDLQDRSNFARFFRDFGETVFFRLVTKQRSFIDEQSWYDAVQVWTYAGVVEAFYRSYATTQHKTIWGDKTPFYLLILPLLRKLFPEARFVHIIRDARDYALSLKKGWGKNVLRSSQRWHDAVAKCRHDGAALKDDYLEVRYEQLVDEPASVLRNVCSFLSVPYEETMTTLKQPADKRGGDAKGSMDILKRNYGKWERSLSRNQIRRIEAICGSLLSDLGYPVTYRGEPQRILPVMMIWYQALDVLSLLRFEIRENGVAEAIRNMYRAKQYAPFRSVDMEEEE